MYTLFIEGQTLDFYNKSSAEAYFKQSKATYAEVHLINNGMRYVFKLVK